jgi:predicted transcriptional regulator
MDPRSSATSAELDEQLRLGLEIFGEVRRSRRAAAEINAVKKRLDDARQKLGGHQTELLKQVTALQAAIAKIEKGSVTPASSTMGLQAANSGLLSALRVVEGGDRTTPSQAIEVYKQSDEAAKARIAEWAKLKSTELPRLNSALQKGGLSPIQISQIEHEVEFLVSQ